MSSQTCIFFVARQGADLSALQALLPDHCTIIPNAEIDTSGLYSGPMFENTHEVDFNRYSTWYAPGYERGPWPLFSHILITLLSNADIEKVWYVADVWPFGDPITKEKVQKLDEHFLAHSSDRMGPEELGNVEEIMAKLDF